MQLDLLTATFKPLEHLKQSEILYFFFIIFLQCENQLNLIYYI